MFDLFFLKKYFFVSETFPIILGCYPPHTMMNKQGLEVVLWSQKTKNHPQIISELVLKGGFEECPLFLIKVLFN